MRLVFNKINKDTFEMIRNGRKRVETRAATSKYQKIEKGETITFSCDGEVFERTISKITFFKSIDDLLETYNPTDINPTRKTKEDIVKMYYSFPGYKEKIESFGLVALELK